MSIPGKRVQKSTSWRLRTSERRLLLLLGDFLVSLLSLLIGLYAWSTQDFMAFSTNFLKYRVLDPVPWFYLLPFIWIILMIELYDNRRSTRWDETMRGVGMVALISSGIYLLVYFTSPKGSLPRWGVVSFILANSLLTLSWRYIYIRIFTAPQLMRRVIIVGAGKAGSTLTSVIADTWPPPFFLVGLIDDDPEKLDTIVNGYPVLGDNSSLLEIIQRENVSDLVLSISGEMQGSMFQVLLDAEERGVEISTMQNNYEEILGRVPIFHLDADWMLRSFIGQVHVSSLFEMVKRLLDILGGLLGSLGLLVIYPFIAIAILLDTGAPIFFLQNRLGKNGKMYKIIKFRTMIQDSEKNGEIRVTVENDSRITRVGKFMRKSHLDELPQFINVLRGEMSLVGPRAERSELVANLQKQIPFYRARLLVKPGITGWAQVNFGYAATVEDTAIKLEYDLYYIKHRNLILDFTILVRTIGTVIGFQGQ